MVNRHHTPISAELLEEFGAQVDLFINKFAPFTVALTAQERHDLPKMGDKSLAFVSKANEFAHKNSDLFPSFLDLEAFDIDYVVATGIVGVLNRLRRLLQMLDDTSLAAGSEAYQASLAFYSSLLVASKANIPGAKTLYTELKERFPRVKRRPVTDSVQDE